MSEPATSAKDTEVWCFPISSPVCRKYVWCYTGRARAENVARLTSQGRGHGEERRQYEPRRMTAELEGGTSWSFYRHAINKPWKIQQMVACVHPATRPMIKELEGRPESGFLGHIFGFKAIVQCWHPFRTSRGVPTELLKHWPAWVDFNKRIGAAARTGHLARDLSRCAQGDAKPIYSGMPPFGLGTAGKLVPISAKRESARERISGACKDDL